MVSALSQMLPASLYHAQLRAATSAAEPAAPAAASAAEPTVATRLLAGARGLPFIPAPSEKKKIALYSKEFYTACTIGGILSCGLTHTAVTPLDVVKCNMQARSALCSVGQAQQGPGQGLTGILVCRSIRSSTRASPRASSSRCGRRATAACSAAGSPR